MKEVPFARVLGALGMRGFLTAYEEESLVKDALTSSNGNLTV